MGMGKIKENIERLKLLSEDFLNKNKKVFIKDHNGNYYFADILLVGEDSIHLKCFAPVQRIGEKLSLNWYSIVILEEYKEVSNGK